MSAAGEQGYSFAAAAEILDVSDSRLRYWSQTGFVGPSQRRGGKPFYTFTDLVNVKAAKELIDRGFGPAEIRKALDAVKSALPGADRPLDRLRVAFDGNRLLIVEDGAAFEVSGQRVFDFGLADLARKASSVSAAAAVPLRSAYEWWRQGLALEEASQPDSSEIEACYRRALAADPGLAAAHTNLGALAYRRGDAGAARASFDAALALDPDQPEARYNLARLHCEAGDDELAVAELRRVLQIAPAFADAHYNLATALERLGGKQQAREHLLRYLELLSEGDAGEDASAESWAAEARARVSRLS